MDLPHLANVVLSGIAAGAVYATVALGHNLVFSATGVLNFSTGAFYALGAYGAGWLVTEEGWPAAAAVAASIAFVMVLACLEYLIGIRPALRRGSRLLALIATIAFGLAIEAVVGLAFSAQPRGTRPLLSADLVLLGEVRFVPQRLGGVALAVVLGVGLHLWLRRSLTGRALSAVEQDDGAARLRGLPVRRLSMLALAAGAAIAAVAGFYHASDTLAYPTVGALPNLKGFVAAALGGIPSVLGAVLGGLMLGVIEALGADLLGAGYRDVITYAVLLVVLALRPSGLVGREVTRDV